MSGDTNNGYFNLKLFDFEKDLSIQIYNGLGQMVYHQSCDSETERIQLEGFSTGIYYIHLMTLEGRISTSKMMITSD